MKHITIPQRLTPQSMQQYMVLCMCPTGHVAAIVDVSSIKYSIVIRAA